MQCPECKCQHIRKKGKNKQHKQKYICVSCSRQFILDDKTHMTRVKGENTRLRHYLARLHKKTLCYSKSLEMLGYSIGLLIHYLHWEDVPVPYLS